MAQFAHTSTPPPTPDARSGDPAAKARVPLSTLRPLWPFLARHRGLLVAWLLALVASSTATLSLPLAVRRMIYDGFASGAGPDGAFVLLFLVTFALAIATAARFIFVSLLGERVVADLRTQLFG